MPFLPPNQQCQSTEGKTLSHPLKFNHLHTLHHTDFSQFYLLRQVTGSIRRIENFVKEDGIVEGKAEPDWMCRLHLVFRNVQC